MPIEFNNDHGILIAVLSGALDQSLGEEFVSKVESAAPRGSKLIVDGSALKIATQQGILQLIAVQRWISISGRRRLPLVGFKANTWRAITENGSDFFFDSKPTLAEALFSLQDDPPTQIGRVPTQPLTASSVPTAPAALLPVAPAVNPPPAVPLATTPLPAPRADALSGVGSSAASYAPSTYPPEPPYSSGKTVLWVAALLLLGALGLGAWWLSNRAPTLALSATSTVAEEDGREVDEITAQVSGGKLVTMEGPVLPRGIYFEPPPDGSGGNTYTLRGRAEPGTRSTVVALQAVDDRGRHSVPTVFSVAVKEKPMTWQLGSIQALKLKVGERIWYQAKFVVNADKAIATSGLPPGLVVERISPQSRDWQITGTPSAPGIYQVAFSAISPSGKLEEQVCPLQVEGEAVAQVPAATPVPVAIPVARPVETPAPTPVPRSRALLDDGMRRFLLDRIENLPSRYTDEDRDKLRAVVGTLQQARLIGRVLFERDGQTDISADQAANLRMALRTMDNAALLENAFCQVVVVGYASRTGSLASNVRISKARAQAVNNLLRSVLGRSADLCGDYGPTGVVDQSADDHNRVVEVYAGMLKPSPELQADAARFKEDFNRRHGSQ